LSFHHCREISGFVSGSSKGDQVRRRIVAEESTTPSTARRFIFPKIPFTINFDRTSRRSDLPSNDWTLYMGTSLDLVLLFGDFIVMETKTILNGLSKTEKMWGEAYILKL
jgi:hypothetical protein